MKLGVKERILLSNILPAEGDFRTMKIVQTLRTDLLFNEDEVKKFEIKSEEGGRVIWSAEISTEVDIKIGEIATEVIVAELKKLDTEKKLTADYLDLYGKFVKDY